MEFRDIDLSWDGHGSIHVSDNGFTIAVNPISDFYNNFKADIVLITSLKDDYFDISALKDVKGDKTVFVFPKSLDNVPFRDVEFLEPGERIDVYNVEIEGVGYNKDNFEDGLGYRFVLNNVSVYVAGDTEYFDGLIDLEKRVDVSFLPIDGVNCMDVDDAVDAAVKIKPSLVIPYHYGGPFLEDPENEVKEFKAEMKYRGIKCKVLE